jgi:hypothetical protein
MYVVTYVFLIYSERPLWDELETHCLVVWRLLRLLFVASEVNTATKFASLGASAAMQPGALQNRTFFDRIFQ